MKLKRRRMLKARVDCRYILLILIITRIRSIIWAVRCVCARISCDVGTLLLSTRKAMAASCRIMRNDTHTHKHFTHESRSEVSIMWKWRNLLHATLTLRTVTLFSHFFSLRSCLGRAMCSNEPCTNFDETIYELRSLMASALVFAIWRVRWISRSEFNYKFIKRIDRHEMENHFELDIWQTCAECR